MIPGLGHGVWLSDAANCLVVADAVKFVRLPSASQRMVAADAIRLVANTAEDPLFVHADHLGTPRRMTDTARAVVWDHVTRPFGETVSLLGVFENNRRFPGQYFDSETDLHYNYFRDYDPALGRYVQSDPIGLDGGLNTYAYVGGNPIKLTDPTGEAPPLRGVGGVHCEALRGILHVTCKGPNSPRACSYALPCPVLDLRLLHGKLCISLRIAVSSVCFGGPDSGHQEQINGLRNMVANCQRIINIKCRCS